MKEVVLDSNIFVRYFVEDVPNQLEKVQTILKEVENEKIRGLVSILVINEVIWILEKFYNFKRKNFLPKLLELLALKNLKIIEVKKDLLLKILLDMQTRKIDFTDIYLFQIAKEKDVFTFDKDLKKLKS